MTTLLTPDRFSIWRAYGIDRWVLFGLAGWMERLLFWLATGVSSDHVVLLVMRGLGLVIAVQILFAWIVGRDGAWSMAGSVCCGRPPETRPDHGLTMDAGVSSYRHHERIPLSCRTARFRPWVSDSADFVWLAPLTGRSWRLQSILSILAGWRGEGDDSSRCQLEGGWGSCYDCR